MKFVNALRWLFGVGFALSALSLIKDSAISAIGAIILGMLLIPVTEKKISAFIKEKGAGLGINRLIKVVIVVLAFFMVGSGAPKTPSVNKNEQVTVTNTEPSPIKVESEKITVSISPSVKKLPSATPTVKASPTPTKVDDKATAQKELDEFVALGKKADLISSYEFSDSATVVYVGSSWYSMTVTQKKDFIAYIGMKKKIITGYGHFEVRDAYSDEKVGELTAFAQELKVYK